MVEKLKKIYFILLMPAVCGLIFLYFAKSSNFLELTKVAYQGTIAPLIFLLSVIFAVALPIFYRTLFAHRVRHRKNISEDNLIKFERNLIYSVLVTPYMTLIAYLFELPRFYFTGTILMSIYAVYYYYPSEKRIQFEKRIFRVTEQ